MSESTIHYFVHRHILTILYLILIKKIIFDDQEKTNFNI